MQRISSRLSAVAILFCAGAGILAADRLTLRDGQTIQGTFLGGTSRQVRIEINGEVRNYDVSLIRSLTFSESADSPPPQMTAAPRPAPAPPEYGGITIPADTMITVRLVDAVNSETSRLGQTYMASLDEPIVVNGNTLIPRGADVTTKLVADQQAGKLTGRTVQTLALVSIKYEGRWVELSSYDVRTESGSQGAKSSKIVGGTAALGAIIGGIAGGGKGAAIGAGSGAAVGTGAAVMTSGEKVVIPSETRLTFKLQNPARL